MLFPFISPNTKCPVALGRYLWYKRCRLDLSFNAGSCHRSFEEHNDYHVSCRWFCFYGPWTSPFTSPLYILYRCIWHWQQYNIVYVYTYYIDIYIYSHIQNIISICTLSQPFRELSLVINMRVPSLQNLRSDSLRTDVGDL